MVNLWVVMTLLEYHVLRVFVSGFWLFSWWLIKVMKVLQRCFYSIKIEHLEIP